MKKELKNIVYLLEVDVNTNFSGLFLHIVKVIVDLKTNLYDEVIENMINKHDEEGNYNDNIIND